MKTLIRFLRRRRSKGNKGADDVFSEVLKIIPKLDEDAIKKMEKNLSSRFTKIAKSFGKGIGTALKGLATGGLALGLVDKLLNPLKEVQESIDRTLKTSDDLSTNAKQFNTTSGKLFKLVTLAKATGLDQDNLFMLITKYQTAVAQARANPNDPTVSSVKNFTGQADTAEGFFNFIQSLHKMTADQQVLVEQQIFGEKQILKMADFLQSIGDPDKLAGIVKNTGIGKTSSATATKSIEHLGDLNDLADALKAGREFSDEITKGGLINDSMVRNRDKSEQIAIDRENRNIQNYNNLASISQTVDKIQGLLEQATSLLGPAVQKITDTLSRLAFIAEKWAKSPAMRGIMNMFGGGKDQ